MEAWPHDGSQTRRTGPPGKPPPFPPRPRPPPTGSGPPPRGIGLCGMSLRISIGAAAAAFCLGVVGPVLAQAPDDLLPAGPGKDVVVRVCTACHDATQFAYARHTPDEWDSEIAKMQSAGAEMTAEEQAAISAYLAKNLPSSAPPAPA